jgi:hypothetical protein
LIYFVLTLLLTRIVGPTKTGSTPDGIQKLFNIFQSHLGKCSKEGTAHLFYTCPSHFWPEIRQNFVPMTKSLGKWIRQRISGDSTVWYYLTGYVGIGILKYDAQLLDKFGEEAKVWILLNRYLKLASSKEERTYECLLGTLNSLTGVDLEGVSRLPYGGNSDLFEEINALVNDPKKARLLDGLKRASRNGFEMTLMLKSLRRWLEGPADLKETIFYAALEKVWDISIEQLRTTNVKAPDFKGDQELAKLFGLILSDDLFDEIGKKESSFRDSLPRSFSNHAHLTDFLTRLGEEAQKSQGCKDAIKDALRDIRESTDWDKVVSYNECVMTGLSKLPDEFFEGYAMLKFGGRIALNSMLLKANLPTLPVSL